MTSSPPWRQPRRLVALLGVLLIAPAGCFAQGPASQPASKVKIPITVRSFLDQPVPPLPVCTGVPLPRSAVSKPEALRLIGPAGEPVPAQFDVQATWADGSIKWVLVSFGAARPPTRRTGPEWRQLAYTLTDDASADSPAPRQPARVRVDTNDVAVVTGPLRVVFNRHSFCGISQAWLDLNGDGTFTSDERIAPETRHTGIVAVDAAGKVFTSALGKVRKMTVERRGPMQAVVAFFGDLRSAEGDRPLLSYAMRAHAFAGSSLVRVVLTIHNPQPAGRVEDGSRWVLGQGGSVHLKSLQYVQQVRLGDGVHRVTLAAEPAKPGALLDRIPLTGPVEVSQDSSGGENWFHRTHVNKDNVIPLSFRGYTVSFRGRQVHQGLRASPWVDVADGRWALSAAMPGFWQNFPKRLAAEADGTLRLGLWPQRPGGCHEIQGGEQKTHEFYLYFRHRRRTPGQRRPMPLARELMPACLARPMVWPAAQAYADANAADPIVPAAEGRFAKYEAVMAAPIRDSRNLYTHREEVDEYGWRHFGDTWAANEGDKTQGPHTGLRVVSHYNNEYDLGFGMLMQAFRNVDADCELARAWWILGTEALWHEADIDIYHCRTDPAPIYSGGTFTHTAHGVEAGRSTHRASPRDEVYGLLEWPWGRGGGTESGHLRNRGILLAYLLGGDRHLLDAANDVRDLVAYKVANDRFAQIDHPIRDAGNNLQILLDAYLLSWDEKYLKLCDKVAARTDFDAVSKRLGRRLGLDQAWSCCIYLKSLGRLIEAKAERGLRDEKLTGSYLKYVQALYDRFFRRGRGLRGSWSLLACEVLMQAAELTGDADQADSFRRAAKVAFGGMDRAVREDGTGAFWNSKATTMHLQGGGRYMRWALTQPATAPAEEDQ